MIILLIGVPALFFALFTSWAFTFNMSEDEVVESDLTSEQHLHVDFVSVEGAKQDLERESSKLWH